jgi:outer membrane protein
MNKYILVLLFQLHSIIVNSQNAISLEQCIVLASKNKKLLALQSVNYGKALINQKFGLWSFLPTLSTSPNYNISFGRKLDPFTNTFGSQVIYSNSFNIGSQVAIFQGFRYFKQNKLFELNISTASLDIERTFEKNNQLVIDKCLAIWKTQIKIDQQKKIIDNIQKFKTIQVELVKEGRINSIDTLETEINFKNQTITLKKLENEKSYNIINLNYLIDLPLMNKTVLEKFNPNLTNIEIKIDEFYQLEELENKLTNIVLQYKIDKAQYLPSVSFFGNVGTGYSTNNKDYSEPTKPIIPYDKQISNNAYQGLGFSLNIPIFNKGEYFKRFKIYEISKTENELLLENKKIEIEKKKLEIELQKRSIEETIALQKEILNSKELIFEMNKSLYFEGKIRLAEVEKIETEYYNFMQSIQDLEIDFFKLNLFKL